MTGSRHHLCALIPATGYIRPQLTLALLASFTLIKIATEPLSGHVSYLKRAGDMHAMHEGEEKTGASASRAQDAADF